MIETKKSNVRTFRQGYEALHQLGYQTADLMVTDAIKFAEFGVTQTEVDNMKILLDALKSRSHDEIMLLKQQMVTEAKKEKLNELLTILFNFEVKLRSTYGKNHMLYERLDIKSISTLTDNEVASKSLLLADFAENELAEELSFVMNEETITALREKGNELSALILKQNKATILRTLSTQERRQVANNLYQEISRIRYIGKQMWLHSDYIKSKTYLMPALKASADNDSPPDDDEESFEVEDPVFDNA